MEPFYQGQLDVFCAIYAVANALHITQSMSLSQAKRMLAETLCEQARDPEQFAALVYNETDYYRLVDRLLECYGTALFPVRVARPFAHGAAASPAEVWETLAGWLQGGERRSAVLRFRRYLPFRGVPIVQHWTTPETVQGDTILYRDSSHEPYAVRSLERFAFVTCAETRTSEQTILVEPASIRLLEPAG